VKFKKLKTMGNLGATEILLILLVVVLLFGGKKIPEMMKGIGQGMKEFKKASQYDPAADDKKVEKEEIAKKE
jgi:sec-independent protein translocase protein TatA